MTTATPDAAADSSTAPADASVPISSLTSEERAQWRLTGEKPTQDVPAESSPAPAGDQPASTDASTSAASEPAKGKGVKARSAELDAEIAAMRERLKTRALLREELARLDAPASATVAPPPSAVASPVVDLARPMLSETEYFAAFPEAAYGQYGVYTAKYVLAEDRQQQQIQTQQQQLQSTWQGSIEAVRAEHPDYDVAVQNFESVPDTPANRAMAAAIQESGNARLYYHLATHLDEARKLARLSPTAALVAIGQLDAQLTQQTTPTPLPNTITSAPPPPPQIRQRASVPASDIDAALAAHDFRRYKELANARDIAAARGSR
jgi:hypothetical protein